MNARPLKIALTLLAMLLAAPADEKKSQPTSSALITRVHSVSRSYFFGYETSGTEKPKEEFLPKSLPPTRSGGARFEVTGSLTPYGLKAIPGSSAIFLEKEYALVLTTSAEMQEFAERIFFGHDCDGWLRHCEISATLVEFDEDPLVNSPLPRRSLADIKTVAADSLRVVDAVHIVTKSGQRTIGINKEATPGAPAAKRANPENKEAKSNETEMELAGSRGSLIEVEPTIGPYGVDVDVQIRYEGRFSRGNTRPDAEFRLNTNLTVPSGQDIVASMSVVHDAQDVPKEKIRRRALLVCARIVSPDGRSTDERRLAEEAFLKARDERLIREATENLDATKK